MSNLIVPEWKVGPGRVRALCTTRQGGTSKAPYDDGAGGPGLNLGQHVGDDAAHVSANRAWLRTLLPSEPVWLNQVHGANVVDAGAVAGVPDADASFATTPGVVCAVLTADCLPVLFCDLAGQVVAAAHAGWRGLAAGVLRNTVARMREAGAQQIQAWLGPAIGPRRFEVGADVLQAFIGLDPTGKHFALQANGKYLADIYALARLELRACGVDLLGGGSFCTVEDAPRFYSYRRDGVTGRMASLIWIDAL